MGAKIKTIKCDITKESYDCFNKFYIFLINVNARFPFIINTKKGGITKLTLVLQHPLSVL